MSERNEEQTQDWSDVECRDAELEVNVLDSGEVELVLGDDVYLFDAATAFEIGTRLQAAGMAFTAAST